MHSISLKPKPPSGGLGFFVCGAAFAKPVSLTQCKQPEQAGFTLTELVTVLVLAGILAAVAIPRIADRVTFESRGFTDEVRSALQYGRKVAVAQRRNVCVTITSSTVALKKAAAAGAGQACSQDLQNPLKNTAFVLTKPTGVTLSSTPGSFVFDALGQTATAVTVDIQADVARQIQVEAVTGYVR